MQGFDGFVQRGIGTNRHQFVGGDAFVVVLEHVSPGGDHVTLDVVLRRQGTPVVLLQDGDKIGNG